MESTQPHRSGLRTYAAVFVGLAILTAMEIFIAAQVRPDPAVLFVILVGFAAAKVVLIASFFMHLKDDSKWFVLLFLYPLVLATLLILGIVFDAFA